MDAPSLSRVTTAPLKGDANGDYRVAILGNSGAGKSTTASRLAVVLGPHVEYVDLDAHLWQDGWKQPPKEEVRKMYDGLTNERTGWTTDSNYNCDIFVDKATDVIWLDFPFLVTFWRLCKRTFWRVSTGQRLFGTNNTETFWGTFFSKDSILVWCWTAHADVKGDVGRLFRDEASNEQVRLQRFTSTRDVEKWLERVRRMVSGPLHVDPALALAK